VPHWFQPKLGRRALAAGCAAGVVLMGLLSFASCGGRQGRGHNLGRSEDKFFSASGRITERASRPFSLVFLETSDGKLHLIQSSPIADELRRLIGMNVFVTGKTLRGGLDADTRVIDVESYDLLRLPSGEQPIVGIVRLGGWLLEGDAVWKIEGDFAEILNMFEGAKVWVVGVVQRSVPRYSYKILLVTEYGVIRP